MYRPNTIYKQKQSKTVLNKYVCGFWCERTTDFPLALLWIMTRILARSDGLKLKHLIDGFVYYKSRNFTRHYLMDLEFCGLLRCFYQPFGLSFWRHPFTAEDPLVSKRCNATFLYFWVNCCLKSVAGISDSVKHYRHSTKLTGHKSDLAQIISWGNEIWKLWPPFLIRWGIPQWTRVPHISSPDVCHRQWIFL